MNLCESNKAVSLEVKNFMLNVPDVKEESITDYLVWKWRELDARFKYINVSTFTRQEENKTGVDFELELWLVGRKFHFPLIFQAKKFVKQNNSYVTKLNYPKSTQSQLKKLLAHAKANKKLPFYVFYSLPDKNTQTMCGAHEISDTSIFMADAHTVKKFADGVYGKRVSKNKILKESNPFHCIFCCPLTQSGHYFASYFSALTESAEPHDNKILPSYVNMLLSGQILELEEKETLAVINQNELYTFRVVGAYDMRGFEEEPNKSINRTR
ncbi:DUF6615 family protein [Cellvibrio sp. PSBB006]|uniref:DUF6615 family protein n=1 Tax=Cellvibrio sp. PSBB006 TaxID=1987723 RepID=UPI000B3B5168|nr:DUF6615 family protein [Cellvibrio sp. PSBB006]ARU26078.1 hypothetical protein CBR65_00755 [Cellvibrio sp. PSBB006]